LLARYQTNLSGDAAATATSLFGATRFESLRARGSEAGVPTIARANQPLRRGLYLGNAGLWSGIGRRLAVAAWRRGTASGGRGFGTSVSPAFSRWGKREAHSALIWS